MKIYVVGGGCKGPLTQMGFTVVNDPYQADLFQFMGGEDVSPELYGQVNTNSYNNFSRDINEMGWYQLAKLFHKPCVGICRGGQFLNVMSGGRMIQDVNGHTQKHILHTIDGGECMATSTHHQMMVVGPKGKLLGWGPTKEDVEIVWYPENQTLCFQPHPEYHVTEMPELSKRYVSMIKNYLFQ